MLHLSHTTPDNTQPVGTLIIIRVKCHTCSNIHLDTAKSIAKSSVFWMYLKEILDWNIMEGRSCTGTSDITEILKRMNRLWLSCLSAHMKMETRHYCRYLPPFSHKTKWWDLPLMFGNEVWLAVGFSVNPERVGWVWVQVKTLRTSSVLPQQTAESISYWSCLSARVETGKDLP